MTEQANILTPPNDQGIEKAVLGAILIEPDAIFAAITIINPNVFYNEKHKEIYQAIILLQNDNEPIDILTVSNKLREKTKLDYVGGAYYISLLTSNIGSSFHLEKHCRILYELFLRREMLLCFNRNIKDISANKDIFDTYNQTSAELSSLFEMSLSSDYYNMSDVMKSRLSVIAEIKKDESQMIGIDSGFSKLNSLTNGFQSSDYIILGARPSMGKTIISLLIAKAAMFHSNKKVLYFSLEMSKERLADRLLSIESNIDSRKISSNNLNHLDWESLENGAERYIDNNLFIIDNSGLSIEDIKARSITLNRKFDIGLILIDYIQLMKHSFHNKNTNDNVTHISKSIKALAKDINCPIVALSQLKRNENRSPTLSDLRDSGSLEQDADIVWFLHRDDYEGRECEPEAEKRIENIIAKNRNGGIGIFHSYRSEDWSYIGEIEYNEFLSLGDSMPFDNSYGIKPNADPF
jgi:replicative DNA helicase